MPVVAVNKSGGPGTVGADFVAKGKKDGYNLLYINANVHLCVPSNPEDIPTIPFRISSPCVSLYPFRLLLAVQPDAPWKTLQDLGCLHEAEPGKIREAPPGWGLWDTSATRSFAWKQEGNLHDSLQGSRSD